MGLAARLWRWLGSLREDGAPIAVAEKRAQWRAIATEHGLTFEPGPLPGYFQDDRTHGRLGDRDIRVNIFPDYDIQKLVVHVAVSCDAVTPMNRPSRDELVAWYEARRQSAGLPPTDPELAPWVLGRRLGVGAFLQPERQLVYLQVHGIEPDTLGMMLAKLPAWARQLELAGRA